MADWLEHLQDFLFPLRTCALCKAPGDFTAQHPWCADCDKQLMEEAQEEKRCAICQRGLSCRDDLCSHCRHRLPVFQAAMHLGPYTGKLKTAIHAFKYDNQKVLATALGRKMTEKILQNPDFSVCEILVPVPLFPKKERDRGYNQSALVARQIARKTGWAVDEKSLVRIRNTPSQTTLSFEERQENVRDAFLVNSDRLAGKHILLVDDVYTTGATIQECSRMLLAAGAKSVRVFTIAAVP